MPTEPLTEAEREEAEKLIRKLQYLINTHPQSQYVANLMLVQWKLRRALQENNREQYEYAIQDAHEKTRHVKD